MKCEVQISPKNSVIFVMDSIASEIPITMGSKIVAFTQNCVAICTLMEMDGETHISLTDEPHDLTITPFLVFNGILLTPSKTLTVRTSENEQLLMAKLQSSSVAMQIWTSEMSEPSEICIFVGESAIR